MRNAFFLQADLASRDHAFPPKNGYTVTVIRVKLLDNNTNLNKNSEM